MTATNWRWVRWCGRIGSPLGLEQSVTFGILSGKHRSFTSEPGNGMINVTGTTGVSPYHDFLQTDAAVNPGNSGGPLGGFAGQGDRHQHGDRRRDVPGDQPGDSQQHCAADLRTDCPGWARDARLAGGLPARRGVEEAESLGLSKPEGALVVRSPTQSGRAAPRPLSSPASQPDDVIIRWDNKPVTSRTDLFSRVAMTEVGATVDVVIVRDGEDAHACR